MYKTVPINVVGGSVPSHYNKISIEASFNMIVNESALTPYAGYKKVANINDDERIRGIFSSNLFRKIILVTANIVNVVDAYFGVARIGRIDTSSGDVYFADNGNSQIAISDGKDLYVYNYKTGSFQKLSLGFAPGQLTSQGGYIFAVEKNTSSIRYSAVNNALLWDVRNASSFGNEYAVGVKEFGNQVFMFGNTQTKILRNLGSAINPFHQDPSISILYGAINPNSIVCDFNMLFWAAVNKNGDITLVQSNGGQATEITTPALDYKLSQLQHPESCYASIFKKDGHIFYHITFDKDNFSLVYDATNKSFLYATDENLDHHIAKQTIHFNNNYYFISFDDGFLYELSDNFTNYDGKIIPRIRTTSKLVLPNYNFFRVNKIEVYFEQGHSNEVINADLAISKNGAASFGNYVRKKLAKIGDRKATTQWNKLGWTNDWVFQFRFYSLDRVIVLGASADIII